MTSKFNDYTIKVRLNANKNAYYFNNTAGKSDDKEPGNISISFLNNLERNNLNNHLIAVVRFYGGTKLGASNLSRTYGKCASTCINK